MTRLNESHEYHGCGVSSANFTTLFFGEHLTPPFASLRLCDFALNRERRDAKGVIIGHLKKELMKEAGIAALSRRQRLIRQCKAAGKNE